MRVSTNDIRKLVGILGFFGRGKRIKSFLGNLNNALAVYDGLVGFDERLELAAIEERGMQLKPHEVSALYDMVRRLKDLA